MATAARRPDPARTGGLTTTRRAAPTTRKTRPLSRDYGNDSRSGELAESIGRHQRVISEHEGAMLRDIAEFDQKEAWRGDGSLSMRDWLIAHCHVSRARARTLVDGATKVKDLPALSGALADGRLTLDVFVPLAAVATPDTDADLARLSEHWTPKQARQLVAEVKGSTDAEAAAHVQRRFVRFDDERRLVWAQLTGDAYALVKSASWAGPAATTIRVRTTPITCLSRAVAPTPFWTSASNRAEASARPAPARHPVRSTVAARRR